MKKIVFVPQEGIDMRQTNELNADIVQFLEQYKIPHKIIKPIYEAEAPPVGMFLNPGNSSAIKCGQMEQIAIMYKEGKVNDETIFFFWDLWFPGIEIIPYLNYFYKTKAKIHGVVHAGSFTDTDFVRDLERWAHKFEEIVFDVADKIYVGSKFIKNDILKKRICNDSKISVTGLPLYSGIDSHFNAKKENIVLFTGRLTGEKQPHLFDELEAMCIKWGMEGWKFIKTQELGLNKHEYFSLLAKSKFVVSFALQENFGYGVMEAAKLGCIPIVPNSLAYPEFYDSGFLHDGTVGHAFNILYHYYSEDRKNYLDWRVPVRIRRAPNEAIYNSWFK